MFGLKVQRFFCIFSVFCKSGVVDGFENIWYVKSVVLVVEILQLLLFNV